MSNQPDGLTEAAQWTSEARDKLLRTQTNVSVVAGEVRAALVYYASIPDGGHVHRPADYRTDLRELVEAIDEWRRASEDYTEALAELGRQVTHAEAALIEADR